MRPRVIQFVSSFFFLLSIVTTVSAKPFSQTYDIDTGFRPDINGFSFENYANYGCSDYYCNDTFPVENLTSIEMRRMFGDQVCRSVNMDGSCELLKVAESWMDEVNESMVGGHCEGMAVLSSLFFAGLKDPISFGDSSVHELNLQGNTTLQNEIAYWYATQWYMDGHLIEEDPNTQLQTLIASYTKNPKILIPIGIYKRDFSDGHAITAYAVEKKGNEIYWIMVYDNNYPDEERYIIIDTKNNSWQYSGATMSDLAEDLYDGEWYTNPFQLAPIDSRLGQFECDFCPSGSSSLWGGGDEESDNDSSFTIPDINLPWIQPDQSPTDEPSDDSSDITSPWGNPDLSPTNIPSDNTSPWGPDTINPEEESQNEQPEITSPWNYNKIGVNSAINIYIETEDGLKSGYDWEDETNYDQVPNVEIKRMMQRSTAKLPTDLVYYLWMNSPEKEEWTTFDVDITSPGTILYLTDVLESYEYPNFIYTPSTYDEENDVSYESFEVLASPTYLPGVEFVISDEYGEYSFSFTTEFNGDPDLESSIDFLIYHDYDSGQLGIEIYAADDAELADFEGSTFLINGEFYLYDENGEQFITTASNEPIELGINGAFYINYLDWQNGLGFNIDGDLDGDYEMETTLNFS
jgi:hypothetical protein